MDHKLALKAIKPMIIPKAKNAIACNVHITPQTIRQSGTYINIDGMSRESKKKKTLGWATTTNMSKCGCVGSVYLAGNSIICSVANE
jgi:hypothetical protein